MKIKETEKRLLEAVSKYDFNSFAYSEFINLVEQATTSNLLDLIKAVLFKQ